ncbi:hypothetical protein F511_19159 [Dorcoceras hygrometricum]|uniref:Uncharacterized protein n=1 Tax=Dorcoceras hygrometricum TaxID=472368 RepID=A0A2Z7A8E2_9LAMI|nr:hypothetical protein F511_19159 [Dorcoceras hygrometricum]
MMAEKRALVAEKEALEAEKRAIRTELDETKACRGGYWAPQERSRERMGPRGFEGCVAQFRDKSYSEEEHPDSFLNVARALEDMPEEDEEADEEGEEEDDADANSLSSPKP